MATSKGKALRKVSTGYNKEGYGMHSIVSTHPKYKERIKAGKKQGLKYKEE